MHKYSLILLPFLLLATEEKIVEVYAKSVEQNESRALINDDIVINYDGKTLYANKGVYDILNKKLFLSGDVKIISPEDGKRINADSLELEFDNEKIVFKEFFEIDKQDVWIKAKNAIKQKDKIDLKNALFSSCTVDNPDWKIKFTKAKYDLKDKKLELYGAKFYIKDFPFFYFPYIPLFLSKKRRSGLLIPTFDYSQDEGFLYSQPIFWAISKSQDLEIDPQIRSNRGYGIFATYRFVDSRYSYGSLRVGYFHENNSYFKKHNLKYKNHYGVEFFYKNSQLSSFLYKKGFENKLYINALTFSDLDYINTQIEDKLSHHKVGNFYESRINYFIKNEDFYSGIYFKYYKDTTKVSNKETLQILPQISLSTPYKSLIYKNLYYKFDFSSINYTRENGTKALKLKFKAPFEFHLSLFDDYLSLNITQEVEATGYDFYNVPLEQKKYSSIVLNTKVNLSTELIKNYKSGTHIAMFSATYTKSKILSQKFMKYKEIPESLKKDFVDDIPFNSKIDFRTHQYWIGKNLNIDYTLDLNYYPKEGKFRDLHHDLKIKYKNWYFSSELTYSLLHSNSTNINNKIGYSNGKYGASLSFLWKKDILSFETITKELNFSGYYNYTENLKFNASIAYNIKDKSLKEWRFGTFYKRKCWSINLDLGQDIRPVIKSDGSRGSISNNYVKVQLKVLPFGN